MAGETFKKSTAREYFESLAITVILALFGTTFIVQAFKIPTPSMEDNLLVGDVIVFKYPFDLTKHYVKRVIGLPGDRIHVVDTDVFINGEALPEPYKHLTPSKYREDFPGHEGSKFYQLPELNNSGWYEPFRNEMDIVVPEGKYFAMGDNRDNSADSRYWGFVPRELIVGKALIVYWSYESDSDAYRQTQASDILRQAKDLVLNFFGKTRWSRTFKLIR